MNQRAHKCLNQAPEAEEYKIPVSTPAIMRPGDKSAKETVPPVHPPCLPGAGEPLSLLRRPDGHGDSGQKGGPADRTDCPRHSEEIGHDPGEKRAHSLSQGRVKDDNRQPRQHAAMDARHDRWPQAASDTAAHRQD